jgi:TatD DNase family protein
VRNYRLGVDAAPPTEPFSAGIHPWDVDDLPDRERLLADLENINCLAIGEIGLDKACASSFALQQEIFERQLEIAARRNLPVVVHCVKSSAEVVATLAHYPIRAVVFHGFIGSTEQAEQIWKAGYNTSFGFGALRSPKTLQTIKTCPTDRLFLETDDSKISITALYKEVAHLRNVSIESLKNDIYNNYKRVFNK